jgi:hypothetical protein
MRTIYAFFVLFMRQEFRWANLKLIRDLSLKATHVQGWQTAAAAFRHGRLFVVSAHFSSAAEEEIRVFVRHLRTNLVKFGLADTYTHTIVSESAPD